MRASAAGSAGSLAAPAADTFDGPPGSFVGADGPADGPADEPGDPPDDSAAEPGDAPDGGPAEVSGGVPATDVVATSSGPPVRRSNASIPPARTSPTNPTTSSRDRHEDPR